MPFCAICVTDLPSSHLRLAPLGRNDAMVNVCNACFDEQPTAVDSERGGYVPPEEVVGPVGDIRELFTRGAARVIPNYREDSNREREMSVGPLYTGIEDGHVLVRVPRRDDKGRKRDNRAAYEYAVAKYPGEPISAVGQSAHYFLFQRPDPKVLAKAKAQRDDHHDPLAPLHAMQRYGARR